MCRMFARTMAAAPGLSGCWMIPTPILFALPSIPNEIIFLAEMTWTRKVADVFSEQGLQHWSSGSETQKSPDRLVSRLEITKPGDETGNFPYNCRGLGDWGATRA